MNYQLAKKLNDAGFRSNSRTFIRPDGTMYDFVSVEAGGVILPTLSELIEACGDDFASLSRNRSKPTMETIWFARAHQRTDTKMKDEIVACSKDMTEAVANIWFALHPTAQDL